MKSQQFFKVDRAGYENWKLKRFAIVKVGFLVIICTYYYD